MNNATGYCWWQTECDSAYLCEDVLWAIFAEVDEGGSGVCLHPGVAIVVHQMEQTGDDFVVKLLLKNWSEIGGHLSQRITTRKSDAGMLKKQDRK